MISILREWLRRLWGTFQKAPRDADMEEELRMHVEMAAAELQRRGLSPGEAAREARLQTGGIAQAMEQRRDQRGLSWLEVFIRDVRFGVRALRRAPGFTVVAIATLALAIGANTAIFSLVDPLLFRDLPVRDPGSLVQFSWQYPGDPPLNMFGLESYRQYRERNTVFSDMIGVAPLVTDAPAGGEPVNAELITDNFFQMLGVRAAAGRVLDVSDVDAATAVVSWQYWHARFGANPHALGTTIEAIDRRLPGPIHAVVVGVAERRFSGILGNRSDVWISLGAIPPAVRARGGLALMARLKPGFSIAQARSEMRALYQPTIDGLAQRDPQWRHVAIDVASARTGLSTPLHDQFGRPLRLLMAVVGLLLLLACANLAGISLARGAARQHEMGVRIALGAGRLRIVRQLLTESLLLAVAAGIVGAAAAPAGARVLLRIVTSGTRTPAAVPDLQIAFDARVLLFTAGVTLGAALLFGLAPSLTAFGSVPIAELRAGRSGTPPRSRRLFGSALVIAQVALSFALVSIGQMYVAHLAALRDRSLGFDRHSVLLVSVDTSAARRDREHRPALYREAMERLRALPGLRSVAASGMSPLSGAAGSRFVRVDGYQERPENRLRVSLNSVSPNYFATYGTPILAGRDFRDSDAQQRRRVIVNQAMALRYFAGRDPIGHSVWFDDERDPFEIVGVVGDAKYQDARVAPPRTVYVYAPAFTGSMVLALRTGVAPSVLATDVRRVLADVFGTGSVKGVTTLEEQVDASIVPERLIATLSGFFAIVGGLLAAIGLYGLLAYGVARRAREIGIRMALGATRSRVLRMLLAEALRLVVVGLVLGAPLAFWGKRIGPTMLENLVPGGVTPVLLSAAGLIVVALIAAAVPARRATHVDPVEALSAD